MIDPSYYQVDKLSMQDLKTLRELIDEAIATQKKERFNLLVGNIIEAAENLKKEFPYAEMQDEDGRDCFDLIFESNFVLY